MEFKNDKLCLRLLLCKQRRSKLTKSDKKHLNFLIEENISIKGEGDEVDGILNQKGYIERDMFWLVNPTDRKKDICRIQNLLTQSTDNGISFYTKHSELKKINNQNENQFFTSLKNYHWVLGWLFGLYFLIDSKMDVITTFLKQLLKLQ